jgi:Na+/serine symporter
MPLCASIGPVTEVSSNVGIEPDCYARNIELANTIIFQGAASAMHILSLVMTVIMVLHVRGKFTAVGKLGDSFSRHFRVEGEYGVGGD